MIAVVDCGVGNLGSVEKALKYIGCEACVSLDPGFIDGADAVVLPGVGAFGDAMAALTGLGLDKAIMRAIEKGKPFLGICLGLQLLFESSEEGDAKVKGLGLFPGNIRRFPAGMGLKIPHMGWNTLNFLRKGIYKGRDENPYVYFVHSYYLRTDNRRLAAATCNYGLEFDAVIQCDNVLAVQFHPEKSGKNGLAMLKSWADRVSAVR